MPDIITITGNLAEDPRRFTGGGVCITTFRVASQQRRFDRATQQWVDADTNWYSVSAYRSLAENAHASLHKGDRVVVSGRLRLRPWDNGTKKGIAVEIDADAVGHDLLWGTTTFSRTAGRRVDTDTWATPGVEPTDSIETEHDAADDAPTWAPAEATPF